MRKNIYSSQYQNQGYDMRIYDTSRVTQRGNYYYDSKRPKSVVLNNHQNTNPQVIKEQAIDRQSIASQESYSNVFDGMDQMMTNFVKRNSLRIESAASDICDKQQTKIFSFGTRNYAEIPKKSSEICFEDKDDESTRDQKRPIHNNILRPHFPPKNNNNHQKCLFVAKFAKKQANLQDSNQVIRHTSSQIESPLSTPPGSDSDDIDRDFK